MAVIYIMILIIGLIISVLGAYCVIKQNKYHFYGAIMCVSGSAIIGLILAFLLAICDI